MSKKRKITDAAGHDVANDMLCPPLLLDRTIVSLHGQLREVSSLYKIYTFLLFEVQIRQKISSYRNIAKRIQPMIV